MAARLEGKKIAILMTEGVEQVEFTRPRDAIREAGGEPVVVSDKESIQAFEGHDKGRTFDCDRDVADVSVADFDGLVLPGGVINGDLLRQVQPAVRFVREMFQAGRPIAAICHGPWALVEADVVRGLTLTSYPTLQTDIRNAGGSWVDEQVRTDAGVVTSRKPDDLDAFCHKLVEEMCEGDHKQHRAGLASGTVGAAAHTR